MRQQGAVVLYWEEQTEPYSLRQRRLNPSDLEQRSVGQPRGTATQRSLRVCVPVPLCAYNYLYVCAHTHTSARVFIWVCAYMCMYVQPL